MVNFVSRIKFTLIRDSRMKFDIKYILFFVTCNTELNITV